MSWGFEIRPVPVTQLHESPLVCHSISNIKIVRLSGGTYRFGTLTVELALDQLGNVVVHDGETIQGIDKFLLTLEVLTALHDYRLRHLLYGALWDWVVCKPWPIGHPRATCTYNFDACQAKLVDCLEKRHQPMGFDAGLWFVVRK